MDKGARVLAVVATALISGALALIGAPPPTVDLDDVAPAVHDDGPPRRFVVDELDPALVGAAPGVEMAPQGRAAAQPAPIDREIRICWSPTARRLVGDALKLNLQRRGAKVRVLTESDRGARGRITRGVDDLALVAGLPNEEELGHRLTSRVLGYHVLVAVVHEANVVHSLPRNQLRDALIGVSTAWAHLGARGAGIDVVAVEEDPFTDQASSLILLGDRLARGTKRVLSDAAVCEYVGEHPAALGLCSLAVALRHGRNLRILQVDAVAPSAHAYAAGRYPFASPVRVLARDPSLLALLPQGGLDEVLSPPP